MPKPLPEPKEADDHRYFSVCHPYPNRPDMEKHDERVAFAWWISCIMGGPESFIALFHRPTSPNIVIIEVAKEYEHAFNGTGWKRLLGKHKWSEILTDPSPEERELESRIFFCVYSSARDVEKKGWKRVFFEETWFKPTKRTRELEKLFTFPYPETTWCDLHIGSEDPTNYSFCRHIPVQIHAPPVKAPPPPVGSAAWYAQKYREGPPTPFPKIDHANAAPPPQSNAKGKKGKAKSNGNSAHQPNAAIASWSATVKNSATAAPTYSKFVSSTAAKAPEARPPAKSAPPPSSWSVGLTKTANPLTPPGLPSKTQSQPTISATSSSKSAWSVPLAPPGLGPKAQSQSVVSASSYGTRSSSPLDLAAPAPLWSDEMDLMGGDQFHTEPRPESAASNSSSARQQYTVFGAYDPDEEDEEFEGPNVNVVNIAPSIRPQSSVDVYSDDGVPAGGVSAMGDDDAGVVEEDNPWANYDEKKETKVVEELCPIHGERCKKGICKLGSEIEKRKKREQKQKEREREAALASLTGGKGKKNNKGKNGWSKPGSNGAWANRAETESKVVTSEDGWHAAGPKGAKTHSTSSSTAWSPPEDLRSNASANTKNSSGPPSAVSSRSHSRTGEANSVVDTPVTSAQGQDDTDDEDNWSAYGRDDDAAPQPDEPNVAVIVENGVQGADAEYVAADDWTEAQEADESGITASTTVKPDDSWLVDEVSAAAAPWETNDPSDAAIHATPPLPSPGKPLNPAATEYKPWSAPLKSPSSSPNPASANPVTPRAAYRPTSDPPNVWNTVMEPTTVVQPGADWKSPRMTWDTGSAVGRSLINGKGDTDDGWGKVSAGPWGDPSPATSGGQTQPKNTSGWDSPRAGDENGGGGVRQTQGGGGGAYKSKKKGNNQARGGGGGGGKGTGSGRNVPGSAGWSTTQKSGKAPAKSAWQDDVSVGPW